MRMVSAGGYPRWQTLAAWFCKQVGFACHLQIQIQCSYLVKCLERVYQQHIATRSLPRTVYERRESFLPLKFSLHAFAQLLWLSVAVKVFSPGWCVEI